MSPTSYSQAWSSPTRQLGLLKNIFKVTVRVGLGSGSGIGLGLGLGLGL